MADSIKMTISLPERLAAVLDRLVREQRTTRSGAIARLLEQAERERLEAEMAEGYRMMAQENAEDARLFLGAQSEVALRDPAR